jgi:transcriptional regulator with XRE-family HTH domain
MVIRDVPIAAMDDRAERRVLRQFGARVRRIRLQKGMTQEDLAFTCGLDRSYIGSVERGERNVSLLNMHKIVRALGVPMKELF